MPFSSVVGEGDVQFSIREIKGEDGTDYGKGVYLDSTLLEGLTDAEIEERAVLRQEYLNAVMSNARAVLENTYIVDEKGNKRKLQGKGEPEE